jgi:hypothetical protein
MATYAAISNANKMGGEKGGKAPKGKEEEEFVIY